MSERRGVLSAGTFCVDFNKSIARWPDEDTSNEVLAIDRQGGGAGFNMALDIKRLDPELPVEAMGLVGDDELARFLFAECDARGVNRTALRAAPGGATMSVDAFNVAANGRRTHFYHQGVAAEMTPDDFDFSSTNAKILHLGLPGAHKAMDQPWRGEANGWVAVLRKARAAGLTANLELMTTRAERLAELGRPCLPHLDCLIVNDFEIGALAGRETRRADGSLAGDWRRARARRHALGGGSFSRRRDCGNSRRVALRAGLCRPAGRRCRRRQRRGRRFRRRRALRAARAMADGCVSSTRACMRRGVDARGVDNGRRGNG
jgi:sugar/nucleoside kinase (ribokinase family)